MFELPREEGGTLTAHLGFLSRLRQNRTGFATVVATIFMVLAVMFLFFNVFMFVQSQNNRVNDAISQSTQLDADRLLEQMSSSATLIPVSVPGTIYVTLQCVFKNNCSLPMEIVRAYWYDGASTTETIGVTRVIQSGTISNTVFSGTSFATKTVRSVDMYSQVITLVTSRGNAILARVSS
jgi:hypothetical protein